MGTTLEQLCGTQGARGTLTSTAEHLLEALKGRPSGEMGTRDSANRRLSVFGALAEFFVALAAERPVALLIHDLDEADTATQQAIAYLARVLTSLPELSAGSSFRGLIVASASQLDCLADDKDWGRSVELVTLKLGALDRDGLRSLLASPDVVERVHEMTGGNPQRVNTLLFDHERGFAVRDGSLLGRCSEEEADVLKLLAVVGYPLGSDRLRELTELSQRQLSQALSSLLARRDLEKTVADGELRLGFARIGDQRAVYEELSAQEKKQRHHRIAMFLLADPNRADSEECADHLLRGSGAEAVEVALTASQRLEAAFCYERAIELYQRALPLSEMADKERILHRLTAVHEAVGQIDRAIDCAERLVAISPDQIESLLQLARLQLLNRDMAAARPVLARVVAATNGADVTPKLQAQIAAESAEAHLLAGELEAAKQVASAGLGLLSNADQSQTEAHPSLRLRLQNTIGKIQLEKEEYGAARQTFERNLSLSRKAGLPAEGVRALGQLGVTEMNQGHFDRAQSYYQQARELAQMIGEVMLVGGCLQHLGVLAERMGHYDQALCYYQEAVGAWKKIGHRGYLAWIAVDLGNLYLDLGDVEQSRAMLRLGISLADTEPPTATRVNLAILRGRISHNCCRYSEARLHLEEACALAHASGQKERLTRALLYLAEHYLQADRPAAARKTFAQLPTPLSHTSKLKSLLLESQLLLSEGDQDQAREVLSRALESSDEGNDLDLAWQANYLMSGLLAALDRKHEARHLLFQAAQLEDRVAKRVPAALLPRFAEQPMRKALREAAARELARESGARFASHVESRKLPRDAPRPDLDRRRDKSKTCQVIGEHPRIRQVLEQVERVAQTNALVMVRGESGTGKELIADAVHRQSQRKGGPFVKVNCGAIAESLLLSELFGHERGAFTGASQRRIGRFELANRGTIFLDEIGDISPNTQVALLRVLQEHTFERVGGTTPIQVDVRIICATNRNLEEMVAAGMYREDLYYRLKGVQLDVPALRARREDIPLLAEYFLARIAAERGGLLQRLSEEASELLLGYDWPGNIRELENVLRSVSLFADDELLRPDHFGDFAEIIEQQSSPAVAPSGDLEGHAYFAVRSGEYSLKDLKKRLESACIRRALDDTGSNITRAAELLGMKRPRLSQLIKEHGLRIS
jgi:transcriptional regulator with GAF, ATPase, and Fis domain/tetratricopeptide (TPR) repeat protein